MPNIPFIDAELPDEQVVYGKDLGLRRRDIILNIPKDYENPSNLRPEAIWLVNALTEQNNGNIWPAGTSQWVPFYKRYRVEWVLATATFVNTANFPCYASLFALPRSMEVDKEELDEPWLFLKTIPSNVIPCQQVLLTARGGSQDTATMQIMIDIAKLFGAQSVKNDAEFSGDLGNFDSQTGIVANVARVYAAVNSVNASGTGSDPVDPSSENQVSVKIAFDIKLTLFQKRFEPNSQQ